MKKIFFIVLSVFLLSGTMAYAQKKEHKYPVINGNAPRVLKWKTLNIDMGKIPQSVPSSVKFEFTNTGDTAIILTDVHASCTCTTPDWTKSIIQPGKDGYVIAGYNAAVAGSFTKSLSVTTNRGEIDILVIHGEVVAQ